MTGDNGRNVRVWDPAVRIFHWSLVAAFATAWLSGDRRMTRMYLKTAKQPSHRDYRWYLRMLPNGSAGIALMLLVATSGCATPNRLPTDASTSGVAIVSVDSAWARIQTVRLIPVEGGLEVSGRIEKRLKGRRTIPGHVHVELLAEDGTVVAQGATGYQRLGSRTRVFRFSRRFDLQGVNIDKIRVVHQV